MANYLPSPPEASEEEEGEGGGSSLPVHQDCMFTFDENDARHYYNICSNVTPDSARSVAKPHPNLAQEEDRGGQDPLKAIGTVPILQPPPGFGDSSSDDEFFDAQDRFTLPEVAAGEVTTGMETSGLVRTLSLSDINISVLDQRPDTEQEGKESTVSQHARKKSLKRRSFMETDFTSQVSFPGWGRDLTDEDRLCRLDERLCPTVSSLSNGEGEPAQMESKPIGGSSCCPRAPSKGQGAHRSKRLSSELMEMEPDTMEFKSVTELFSASTPLIMAVRCRVGPEGREGVKQQGEMGREGGDLTQMGETLRVHSTSCEQIFKDSVGNGSAVLDAEEQQSPRSQKGLPRQFSAPCLDGGGDAKGDLVLVEDRTCPVQLSPLVLPPPPNPSISYTPIPREEVVEVVSDEDPEVELNSFAQDHWEGNSTCLALVFRKGISLSHESVLQFGAETTSSSTNPTPIRMAAAITKEPLASFKFQGCPPGIMGRLSTSTLRDKIHSLPWYLSHSQETLSSCDSSTTDSRRGSGFFSEAGQGALTEVTEVTEVTLLTEDSEEVTEVMDEVTELAEEATEEVAEVASETPEEVMEVLGEAIEEKADFGCSSMSSPGCPSIPEEAPTQLEVCSCQAVYTNCFSGVMDGSGFDEELTVYEFSRRTQGTDATPLMTTLPSSFSSSSSSLSSSSPSISPFSRGGILPPSSSTELSPLLSPLDLPDCYPPESLEDTLNQLRNRHYGLPGGFCALQQDVDELLALLQTRGVDLQARGGQHHRETCAEHFSENKRLLHAEARKLMSGCQRVTRVGQALEETLRCLAESFRTLVQLASVCLWFSSCARCEGRHAEALDGLREVSRTYGEFARAAEKAGGRKNCHDLSVKLLARQCTALTASVFCLTQLFRTLTVL
ncbi:hypothetical protein AAFF_G00180220 [Aldrovandia affinis]|uniref:Uncharacterized protein n=1 Tax=Aldrovandia affinis TaxID=143900 RepID=A0AAD7SY73_9TELE|nr:hypothetical protein AAFF_G00180220 [Aldrovandia affinis]